MKRTTLLAPAAAAPAAPAARAAEPTYDPRAAFAETDANKDGAVDREEFIVRSTDVFYLGDTDKDGSLSKEELKHAVVFEENYAEFDSTGDGQGPTRERTAERMMESDGGACCQTTLQTANRGTSRSTDPAI